MGISTPTYVLPAPILVGSGKCGARAHVRSLCLRLQPRKRNANFVGDLLATQPNAPIG
jgi:hypothetical protein